MSPIATRTPLVLALMLTATACVDSNSLRPDAALNKAAATAEAPAATIATPNATDATKASTTASTRITPPDPTADIGDLSKDELRLHLCHERARRVLTPESAGLGSVTSVNSTEGAVKALTSVGGSMIPGGSAAKMLSDQVATQQKQLAFRKAQEKCESTWGQGS